MNPPNQQKSRDDEGNEIRSDGGAVAVAHLSLLVAIIKTVQPVPSVVFHSLVVMVCAETIKFLLVRPKV